MATPNKVVHNGIEHEYAPNPRIQENGLWSETYPPIEFDGRFLKNKYTGELVPNNPDNARRSDILEPYYEDDGEADDILGVVHERTPEPQALAADMDEL